MKKIIHFVSVLFLSAALFISVPATAQNGDSTMRTQTTTDTNNNHDYGKWGLAGLLGLLGLLGLRKKDDVTVTHRSSTPPRP